MESGKLYSIKEDLNTLFFDIVEVLTNIVSLHSEEVDKVISLYERANKDMRETLGKLKDEVRKVREILFQRVEEIDVMGLKQEIEKAVKEFLDITDSLELLSYNTICKTFALGEKGAAISHISKEIKKHSDEAKKLMGDVSTYFNRAYKEISDMVSFLQELQKNAGTSKDVLTVEDYVQEDVIFTSDVSRLIEFSQFHDIFIQQLDAIINTYETISWDNEDLFTTGQKVKFYQESIKLLEEMKKDVDVSLGNIEDAIKGYLENMESDLSKIRDMIHSLEENLKAKFEFTLDKINKNSNVVRNHIDNLKSNLELIQDNIVKLKKFNKSFNILIVLTSIEVARLTSDSLFSLILSMNETHETINRFVNNLEISVEKWEVIYRDVDVMIMKIIDELNKARAQDFESKNKGKEELESLDKLLGKISNLLNNEDYLEKVYQFRGVILEKIDEMILLLEEGLNSIFSKITDDDQNQDEFVSGMESVSIKVIKADDEELSTVELF